MLHKLALLFLLFCLPACAQQSTPPKLPAPPVQLGAERLDKYLPLLEGKKVGLAVNQTSMVGNRHLADTLLALGISIKLIFAPEHGFRGEADAGATVSNGLDTRTGLPIFSLYGKNKKPSPEQMKEIDVLVFDMQDVGARFYTYISTMHYCMEACAEAQKHFIVLDRPNPNGHYVDGPVLDTAKHRSFVGMHPIPIVHGLTVGELAHMINGEKWLEGGRQCVLTVISCQYYNHKTTYTLPVRPSPNLPNSQSIALYPSLCLFEGTIVSVGRGTQQQFQVIGYPEYPDTGFSFTPTPQPGAAKPLYEGKICYGKDLSAAQYASPFFLQELIEFYQKSPKKELFFNNFFSKLAGTDELRKQIEQGMDEASIRASWQPGLDAYKKIRVKYLLYE